MTAIQLNAEILRNLGTLAEDESMLKRIAKYLRKLVSEKTTDPTEMTKEEFFARIDNAKAGPTYSMLPDEDLTAYLKRQGYDI